jgi:hypothetical protein
MAMLGRRSEKKSMSTQKANRRLFKRPILGLFKRNPEELNDFSYMILAHSVVGQSYAVSSGLAYETDKPDSLKLMKLFRDTLSFSLCLLQMVLQKRFAIKEPELLLDFIKSILTQFAQFPDRDIPEGEPAVNLRMLENIRVFDDDFLEQTLFYSARAYHSLGITEEGFSSFCRMSGVSPTVLRGAGWTLALVIYQIRVSCILLESTELTRRLPQTRRLCYDACQLMMRNFNHTFDTY